MKDKSWYLTLGFNPYDSLPTEAEAKSAFGKYRNTIGKMSTKSSADADELKRLGESLDKERDSIILEVQSNEAQLEARIALMSIAKDSVDMMKLQSSEFDDTMIDLVLRETKLALKGIMYPKGKNDLTKEIITRVIIAHGGTVAGECDPKAREAYEALQIDEKLKTKFRSIDANLAKVPLPDLYAFLALGTSVAETRSASSSVLVERARKVESLIPRDANSRQVNTLNLAKSAQEVFSSEGMRSAYNKYVVMNSVEQQLKSVKAMGDNGKTVSKDYAIAHAKSLAEDLDNPLLAAKLFIGYLDANDVRADVSYAQLLEALDGRPESPVPQPQPAPQPQPQPQPTPQPPNSQSAYAQNVPVPVVNQQQSAVPFNSIPQNNDKKPLWKRVLLIGCLGYFALGFISVLLNLIASFF